MLAGNFRGRQVAFGKSRAMVRVSCLYTFRQNRMHSIIRFVGWLENLEITRDSPLTGHPVL